NIPNPEIREAVKKAIENGTLPKSLIKTLSFMRDCFGNTFQLNLFIAYIVNFACALIFLSIKGLLLPILNRVWKNDELMRITCTRFYQLEEIPRDYYQKHDTDNKRKKNGKKQPPLPKNADAANDEEKINGWFVKPQTTSYRKLLFGAYIGVFVASLLVFLVSVYHPEWAFFKASFYPVFIILVFGEAVTFLYGLEFEKEEEAPKPAPVKVEPVNPNYRKIWEELRTTYPDNMLRRTPDVLDKEIPEPPKIDKDLGFLDNSEDEDLKTISLYFKQFPAEEIEPSYVEGCLRLLQGKSTLFCNPFYEDLGRYLFPPIIYHLFSYKKCLFIMGRDSTADDFCDWLRKGIKDFLGAEGLWQTEIISEAPVNFELGILKFSDIYNLELLNTNREFFSEVGFVFILEPSRILATGQLALSLIVNQLDLEHCDNITYCACDHNCDGLVDNLSHALKTSMTHVIATLPGNGFNMQVFWDADSQNMQYKILDNVTHYLGIGTEISLIGMKNHVCNLASRNDFINAQQDAHTPATLQNECWFACDKFPIKDMMWIAGQYYRQICEFTGLPIGQEQFNKALEVRSNIWHCPKAQNTYLIIEDEYNNLFEMARIFSSRSLELGFINIISSQYLLREYLIEFIDLFLSDAKALPTIVPDYARTERNVILKLLMMMTAEPLPESFIRRELMLGNFIRETDSDHDDAPEQASTKDASQSLYDQFWQLIQKHIVDTGDGTENVGLIRKPHEKILDDGISVQFEPYYEIREGDKPIHQYLKKLKNAYFICEDEQAEKHYISAKLYGHVLQCYLPGQFITLDGKYYQVVSISEDSGIVLRRAADHIHQRLYYRQVRDIALKKWAPDRAMGACYPIEFSSGMRMVIERGFADYEIQTPGYLECAPYHDIKHARFFELSDIPERNYHYKNVLRLKLPQITQEVIDYKLDDIYNAAFTELKDIRREFSAIDLKVKEAIGKAKIAIRLPAKLDELTDDATKQGQKAKETLLQKVKKNRIPCLKLRDALLKSSDNEKRDNADSEEELQLENDKTFLSDIFHSLNDPEVLARVRFTICLLLSEVFKTTYPESWQYINVVTDYLSTGNLKNANYHFVDETLMEPAEADPTAMECDHPAVESDSEIDDTPDLETPLNLGDIPVDSAIDLPDAEQPAIQSDNTDNTENAVFEDQ
ncbi:MAG: hypothetical protein J6A01_01360, partial [Proteobacteria bacterium]|nr:hypothetical protein [Pseudomonadota bacterium]